MELGIMSQKRIGFRIHKLEGTFHSYSSLLDVERRYVRWLLNRFGYGLGRRPSVDILFGDVDRVVACSEFSLQLEVSKRFRMREFDLGGHVFKVQCCGHIYRYLVDDVEIPDRKTYLKLRRILDGRAFKSLPLFIHDDFLKPYVLEVLGGGYRRVVGG